jgi:hypothetical protein
MGKTSQQDSCAVVSEQIQEMPFRLPPGFFAASVENEHPKSFAHFLQIKHGPRWWTSRSQSSDVELKNDLAAGSECLWRAMGADWWEWRVGSRLFFWRWPPAHQKSARDGNMPYVLGDLPEYKRPQPYERLRIQVRR